MDQTTTSLGRDFASKIITVTGNGPSINEDYFVSKFRCACINLLILQCTAACCGRKTQLQLNSISC